MKYPLTSIKSGDDQMTGMWISIGYRSTDREQHVLHIVGGEETAAQTTGRWLVPIYFERDDQLLSCYEGADKIVVTGSSVTLTLNRNGQVPLELPRTVQFISEKPGREFNKARTMFTRMTKRKGGEVIRIV